MRNLHFRLKNNRKALRDSISIQTNLSNSPIDEFQDVIDTAFAPLESLAKQYASLPVGGCHLDAVEVGDIFGALVSAARENLRPLIND